MTHRVGTSPTVSPSTPSDLYFVQKGVVERLAGSSGKVIWQHPLAKSSLTSFGTIQVVSGVVYVVFAVDVLKASVDIYALSTSNGQQIWHTTSSYMGVTNPWQVANGRVYLYNQDGTYTALNAVDGSQVWHNTTLTVKMGAYPFVDDGNFYVYKVNTDGTSLYGLDGATGQVRQHVFLAPAAITSEPLIANNVVYAIAGTWLYAGQRADWRDDLEADRA